MGSKFDKNGHRYIDIPTRDFIASLVSYDDDATGLGANDVQGAIQALFALVSGGIFAGRVAAAGTTIRMSSNASAWTPSLNTGIYTVTHNLDLASADDLVVVPAAHSPAGHASAQVESYSVNSFDVIVFDDENNGITSVPWGFVAIRLVPP